MLPCGHRLYLSPGMRTCRRYMLADVFGKLGASLGGELRQAPHPRLQMRPRHGQ